MGHDPGQRAWARAITADRGSAWSRASTRGSSLRNSEITARAGAIGATRPGRVRNGDRGPTSTRGQLGARPGRATPGETNPGAFPAGREVSRESGPRSRVLTRGQLGDRSPTQDRKLGVEACGPGAASDTRKRLLRRGYRPDPSEKNPLGGVGGETHSGQGKPLKPAVGRALGTSGLESGKLAIQVAPGHREERSAQAHDFRRGQVLDVQESAQGRDQPVAAVALLVAVKPTLSNRLADQIQGAAAVLSLPKPIERLSRPVMATHAGSRGLGGGLFANALWLPDRSPNRRASCQNSRTLLAVLSYRTRCIGQTRSLRTAKEQPDAFLQNSERTGPQGERGRQISLRPRAITGPGAIARFHC